MEFYSTVVSFVTNWSCQPHQWFLVSLIPRLRAEGGYFSMSTSYKLMHEMHAWCVFKLMIISKINAYKYKPH